MLLVTLESTEIQFIFLTVNVVTFHLVFFLRFLIVHLFGGKMEREGLLTGSHLLQFSHDF